MNKVSGSLILITAILMFAACSDSRSTVPPVDDGASADLSGNVDDGAVANISGVVIECTKDTDCVVVEIECCDHCNGGEVAAVNAAYAEEVREYHRDCDEQTMCTMMACPDELPRCRDGECEHYTDTSGLF